ncbi:MAG TPA: hypothetical protein VFE61_01715 [Candidatus Sulfotelmatobacter sp.]|jgi:hypothetical protein|nr:hypothetical protein [Candidatus Sulfotelmatobacter sp.]
MKKAITGAIGTVAVLFAAFSGFLKGIAPPEGPTAMVSVGGASFLALCIVLFLSAAAKKGARTKERKFLVVIGGVLAVISAAMMLTYWHNRERLTFAYPPEDPQAEYIAGTHYEPAAKAWADQRKRSKGQVVADFGGLPNRHLVWSDASIQGATITLITNYLFCVLSIAGAVFCLAQATATSGDKAKQGAT